MVCDLSLTKSAPRAGLPRGLRLAHQKLLDSRLQEGYNLCPLVEKSFTQKTRTRKWEETSD